MEVGAWPALVAGRVAMAVLVSVFFALVFAAALAALFPQMALAFGLFPRAVLGIGFPTAVAPLLALLLVFLVLAFLLCRAIVSIGLGLAAVLMLPLL